MADNPTREEPVLKPLIDNDLPLIKYFDFIQWNVKHRNLAGNDDSMAARDRFALTGHYTSETTGTRCRAAIDPNSCKLQLLGGGYFDITCDVDSVIGIVMGAFPIREEITFKYYMLASPTHTLNSNLHIPPVKLDEHGDEEVGS